VTKASNASNAVNASSIIRLLRDTDAGNVPLKTEKISPAGCVENTVIMYVAFSFTCLNMVCANLDTQESWGILLFERKKRVNRSLYD